MTMGHLNENVQLEKARNRFTQEISKNMDLYGIHQSIGRLYGTVFFSEEPMTLDEMSKELGMSKTSMSTGIRALSDANMVERVWQKGVRKDLYQAEEDWYKSFSAVFVNRWRVAVDENLKAVEQLRKTLQDIENQTTDETIKQRISVDLEKAEKADKYYQWLGEVINLFENGEIYKIVPKK
ncbi:GbsR/MarR family transcriptional regulator [Bacillus alkalicellulosilyticus]|uniref:GbsR/MarR family transcriptional regulator n=1 Tax=Alkalihalobacterium alkalicellulosilyticum TaxID=1912214 RepID=UPI001117567A|nr:GbsR/MarR family transcriptional regulator [Bacillus alkalicellulosilyticus]